MITIALLFFIGLFIGSFLNVVVDRLPRQENFFAGRSHCEFCKHVLAWYDLVPIFSFVFLQGRCRYCKKFIGWKYPLIELTAGIVFTLSGWAIGINSLLILGVVIGIASCLIIIFYIDLFDGIIPDSVLLVLLIFSIAEKVLLRENFLNLVVAALVTGLCFCALYFFTRKKGIGFGDVKYAFAMGFLLGFPDIIPGLYIAFLTGAVLALILVIARKKSFGSSVPFGPFLVLGTLCNLFWGTQIWAIFQKLLNL